jgi:hypothetical protein
MMRQTFPCRDDLGVDRRSLRIVMDAVGRRPREDEVRAVAGQLAVRSEAHEDADGILQPIPA